MPPELIGYLDDRKNPNIYTREFVELTSKGNRYLNGKVQALEFFRDSLFRQMEEQWPETGDAIGRILEGKGDGVETVYEGENGAGKMGGGGGQGALPGLEAATAAAAAAAAAEQK